jgi:hypothetical protein
VSECEEDERTFLLCEMFFINESGSKVFPCLLRHMPLTSSLTLPPFRSNTLARRKFEMNNFSFMVFACKRAAGEKLKLLLSKQREKSHKRLIGLEFLVI